MQIRQQLLDRKNQMTDLAQTAEEKEAYTEEDIQIPVRGGTTIAVRIHKPKNPATDGCPIFVVYHGGGFCLGGLDSENLLCRRFTELGGIAVNVDYRLAPEHPFPIPPQDAYDALKWVCSLVWSDPGLQANREDRRQLHTTRRKSQERLSGRRH